MTIESNISKVSFVGNGVSNTLSVTYPYINKTDVKVYKEVGGSSVLMELNTDYTLQDLKNANGEITGGTITFTVTPEDGLKIIAIREVPYTQEVDYRENDIFPAETLEDALDKVTMLVQQVKETADRSVSVGIFSDSDPSEIVSEIEELYDIKDSVVTAANISSDIVTCSNNIEAIQDAPNQANAAMNFKIEAQNSAVTAQLMATQAQDWATKTDGKVDGTEYSSKYYAGQASNSANNSHIWAEGTDAQVQALGGVHSSKVWAQQSTNANISLTNSPYTTNRILEIPQNLQISVNGDTITISGKATRLNGDLVNINVSRTFTGTVGKTYVLISAQPYSSMNTWTFSENNSLASYQQDSQPTITTAYAFWFDTANNRLMFTSNTGSSWCEVVLPFGVAHYTSNGWVIDQVFNGFGYIGSTVFVLPGVKYEYSIDVNPDGSYVNQIWINHSVKLYTTSNTASAYSNLTIAINPTTNIAGSPYVDAYGYHYAAYTPYKYPSAGTAYWFNPSTGKTVRISSSGVVGTTAVGILSFGIYRNSGKIDWIENISINPVNTYSRSELSGLGMPSGRYIDLTLGASGSTYIAPANGYFTILGAYDTTPSQTNMTFLSMSCGSINNRTATTADASSGIFIPTKKGQSMFLEYRNFKLTGHSYAYFRFIYAQGEQ